MSLGKKKVVDPEKQEKQVWASGAEMQTLAVDSRAAVWVSTAEKIIPGETRKFSRRLGGGVLSASSAQKSAVTVFANS